MPSGLFMGLSSLLIYTSEFILCSTIRLQSSSVQWATKVVEEVLENDGFQSIFTLLIYFIYM